MAGWTRGLILLQNVNHLRENATKTRLRIVKVWEVAVNLLTVIRVLDGINERGVPMMENRAK